MDAMPAMWECPQCHRRVPMNVEECRCGMFRPRAAPPGGARRAGAAPGNLMENEPFSWRELPGSVKAGLAVAVLSGVGGILWLIFAPAAPLKMMPLLGYMDRPAPIPPSTTPAAPVVSPSAPAP